MKKYICFDCQSHYFQEVLNTHPLTNDEFEKRLKKLVRKAFYKKQYCEHFTIEYWEKQGYQKNWGDAAVRNYPYLTIMRKQEENRSSFVILAPHTTYRPVILSAQDPYAWGSY